MAQTITMPTELKNQLRMNRVALAVYRRLSFRSKQTYADYVIAAQKSSDRKCRSRRIVKTLLGKGSFASAQCR